MKIFTSYFGNLKKLTKNGIVALGVSRYPPRWFNNASIFELAPQAWMLGKTVTQAEYDKAYALQLSKLKPSNIIAEIKKMSQGGKDVALCCFEKNANECHRSAVMKWLNKAGYEIEEFQQEDEAPKAPPISQGMLF